MSLVAFVVRCDWPGCHAGQTFVPLGTLADHDWDFLVNEIDGPHLCPEHQHKAWEELHLRKTKKYADTDNLPPQAG